MQLSHDLPHGNISQHDQPILLLERSRYEAGDLTQYFDLKKIPYGRQTLYDEMQYVHHCGRKLFIANNIASFYASHADKSVIIPWLVSDYVSQLIGTELFDRETRRRLENHLDLCRDRVKHRHLELLTDFRQGNFDQAIDGTPSIVIYSTLGLHDALMEAVNIHSPECYGETDSLRLSQSMLEVFPIAYKLLE